jgi:hypothetical protein
LQLTAPDPKCGLVYVRGSFSDNPDAILARAQRREGGKSTFGLKILPGSGSYTMNSHEPDTQGLVNFRWPYLRYALNHPDSEGGKCAFFSFVKDQTVFQILRLDPGSSKQSENRDISKRSSLLGHPGRENDASKAAAESQSPTDRTIVFRIGGTVRIGCKCRKFFNPQSANYEVEANDSTLSCVNTKYKMKLVSRLFVNSKPVVMENIQKTTRDDVEMDISFDRTIPLPSGKVTVVVAAFSLRDESNNTPYGVLPPSVNLADDLGIGYSSKYATNQLWRRLIDPNGEYGYWDYYTAASCLEQILGVTSVPMTMIPPPPPSSESSPSRRSSPPPTLKTQREEVATTTEARASSPDPMKLNTVSSPEQGEQARNDTSANIEGSESPIPHLTDSIESPQGKKLDPNQESGEAVNAQAIEGLGQASSHPPARDENEIDRHSHQFEQSVVDTPHNKGQSEVLQTASNATSLDPEGVDISGAIVSIRVQPPPLLNTSQVHENNDRKGLRDSGSGTASDLSDMGIALLPGIIGSISADFKRSL